MNGDGGWVPEIERQSSQLDPREGALGALCRARLAAPSREARALLRCDWIASAPSLLEPAPDDSPDARGPGPATLPAAESARAAHSHLTGFVRAVLAEDDAECREMIGEMLTRGVSVQSVYLDLLAPAARVLGAMWDDDTCSFVDVTLGVARLQTALRELSGMFVRDRPSEHLAGRVLLTGGPGEQHSLGLFMVAEFFVRDGWEVRVGPPLALSALLAEVGAAWYDVIGFSMSCDSSFDRLKRVIRGVRRASRNSKVLIMAGGRAFDEQPDLLARVGADVSARNAEMAPERARQMLALS